MGSQNQCGFPPHVNPMFLMSAGNLDSTVRPTFSVVWTSAVFHTQGYSEPIVLVCLTNHALDQFLEDRCTDAGVIANALAQCDVPKAACGWLSKLWSPFVVPYF